MGMVPQLAKYELLEELGHGGMATVYRARDRRLGREVAVKVIHPHLRDSREVVSRFHAEAKAVAMLRHPNIVDVYDVSEPDETHQYLVVGLVRGTTLRKLLQERGAMPPEIAAAVALELLAALAHANANGVVHRDVKPENVLVERRPLALAGKHAATDERAHEPDGPRVAVKLTDFGIAKLLDAQGVTSTGQVLGSPAHMAPEQIEGGEVDARADVFGVGVVLYRRVHGRAPAPSRARILRRCCAVSSSGSTPRPSASGRSSAPAGASSSIARSRAPRPIVFPTRRRCAMPSPQSCSGSRSSRPSAISRRGSTIRRPSRSCTGRESSIASACSPATRDVRGDGDGMSSRRRRRLQPRPRAPRPTIRNLLRKIVAGMNRAEASLASRCAGPRWRRFVEAGIAPLVIGVGARGL